ncbi:TonB-dependent receptor [Pedobacter sp. SL55]|uniref:TonB-dependent receptor n=1 Tax=Pedobacter sp. SL55 TaxID=2995161 RepID=UPI0022716FBE|nr:TonB-dependent receptor [Pedobacter sp. SL55]WAC42493.1 TonB-dependent receptor [Pedobacter sp. SL55]
MKFLLPFLALFFSGYAFAQNTWTGKVIDADHKEVLAEVTVYVKGTNLIAKTDEKGLVTLQNIPNGTQVIGFKIIGHQEKTLSLVFPLNQTEPTTVALEHDEDDLDEVVITSTRSSRTIRDIPTRVEFIAGEELEEKSNMKPGDVRMVLSESTGIQTQTTSATSANAAIRIQGLDGRYTQILKDGFPLYAGAASGLGLLQIQPLDLKQVELIKGSASTLYGGGAIAGLVNFISKTPKMERELNFHLDGTSARGLSLNGFYGKRNEKVGTTIFAAYQSNAAYDPADIDLSAIPKFKRYSFNPKFYYYPTAKTKLMMGLNSTFEDRVGGDMHYINDGNDPSHSYFEQNKTERLSSQIALDHDFGKCSHVTFKNSVGYFNRKLFMPGYVFNGTQYSTFTEANYASHGEGI